MQYSKPLDIDPSGPVVGVIEPPGSKSYTNRYFLLACLASGRSEIKRPLISDDTLFMLSSLKYMGFRMAQDLSGTVVTAQGGAGRIPWNSAKLYVGNAGTAMRFITAAAALGPGKYLIDGDARMRERPIGDLTDALKSMGLSVAFPGKPGFPPVEISGGPAEGGPVSIEASASSQFVSGLMMAGRCMKRGLEISVKGELASKPFVDVTLQAMKQFGAQVEHKGYESFHIPPGDYRGTGIKVEADATAATYFLSAAAVTRGRITVKGVGSLSSQGDSRFASVLADMGCKVEISQDTTTLEGSNLKGVEADLHDMPDTAPTLAVTALFAEGKTSIRNVGNLRIKESDRIAVCAAQLTKTGARVEELPDGLVIYPPRRPLPALIETYNDHRIAMSFSILGLAVPGISIQNPGCVSKTYPAFFEDLKSIATPPTG